MKNLVHIWYIVVRRFSWDFHPNNLLYWKA